MDILNFIFRIGVVLAVYNFLWWLIMLGITILKGNRPGHLFEVYLIKAIRYTFLADVLFLFVIEKNEGISTNYFVIAGLIMLIYFLGQLQKKKKTNMFFNINTQTNIREINNFIKKIKPVFNLKLEVSVIILAMALFGIFYYFQHLAYNPISNWFLESILNIEDTPVFGFVFKVIGFFFLLSVLMKIITGISLLFLGTNINNKRNDFDDFDDFEEVE